MESQESQVKAEPPASSLSSSSPGPSPATSPGTPPRSPAQHKLLAGLRQSPRHKLRSPPRLAAMGKDGVKGPTPPKGRRKKTLPEDKAILEAAYEQNPTPDKAARRELVRKCIDMSEARIQIWFQNRRQIDRRKSEPVPSKVEAFTHGRIQVLSPNMVCQKNKSFEVDNLAVATPAVNLSPPMSIPNPPVPSTVSPSSPAVSPGTVQEAPGTAPAPLDAAGVPRPSLTRSLSLSTGYLANRRNMSSLSATPSNSKSSFRSEPFPSSCPNPTSSFASEPAEPRPSSQPARLCLSLSLDGRAEITESTSSPPRPAPQRPEGSNTAPLPDPIRLPPLQLTDAASRNPRRSLPPVSSLDGISSLSRGSSLPKDPRSSLKYVLDPIGRPPSLRRCRSSDVHAWEACATSQNLEDPLIQQAKHESSGSAVAAINLVRSTNALTNSAILKQRSTNAKRRSSLQPGSVKRHKSDVSAIALSSSRVRVDNGTLGLGEKRVVEGPAKNPGSTTTTAAELFYANDSDKENWSPDEDGIPRPRYVAASGRRSLPSAAPTASASRADSYRNPRRTSAYPYSPSRIRASAPSLQRGNSSPGKFSLSPRRRSGYYRAGGGRPGRSHSSAAALVIYEDSDIEDNAQHRRLDVGGKSDDESSCPRSERGAGAAAVKEDLLSSIGTISPSKEKDVAAATGLLSLKWGR